MELGKKANTGRTKVGRLAREAGTQGPDGKQGDAGSRGEEKDAQADDEEEHATDGGNPTPPPRPRVVTIFTRQPPHQIQCQDRQYANMQISV